MNFWLVNLFLFSHLYLFSTYSLVSSIKSKICIDCKHFTKDFFTTNKFGKCALFPKKEYLYTNRYYLVDRSKPAAKPDYYFCAVARECEIMCGTEGKLFQEKEDK